MLPRRLLVATDLSAASERAERAAVGLATAFGADIVVVHALEPVPYPYPIPALESERKAAAGQLAQVTASLKTERGEAHGLLREGVAWSEIVAVAKEQKVDLVIVGTHGRRGLPHVLLGSVAEKVVRSSPVPVLTVPSWRYEDRRDAGRQLGKALLHFRDAHPIVLALSRVAVPVAYEVANALAAPLDVLIAHAIECDRSLIGAACEEGTFALDDRRVVELRLPPRDLEAIVEKGRDMAQNEAVRLRGARWIGDTSGRTVIVVTDELASEWAAAACAKALGSLGAREVVVASPAGVSQAARALARHAALVTCLEEVRDPDEINALYRDFRSPSEREALDLLATAVRAT